MEYVTCVLSGILCDLQESSMTIASILADKGRAVFTAAPESLLNEAIDLLAEKRVGAIVVVENGDRICGILSERDIVREISANGPAILKHTVEKYMTRKVITCDESDTIDQVMGVMTLKRIRHLPVASNGRLAGIISIGDIVKRKIEQAERDAEELRNYISAG
jgi:CBS domain-containing protein